MVLIYNSALLLLSLFLFPYLALRFLSERKQRSGLLERLGFIPRQILERRSGKPVIWVHSVSVGEVLAAAPLIEQVRGRFPTYQLLLSTTTVTGHGVCVKKVAAPDDLVIYFPLDISFIVRRVLNLFSPRAVLLMETEIWPNLIRETRRRRIPLLLVNGRLSEKSFRRYLGGRFFVRPFLRSFSFIGMQTEEGKFRMTKLGASPAIVEVTGSMKYEASLATVPSQAEVEALRNELSIWTEKVVVAGSTHRGEEQLMLRAYLELREKYPDLFLILAPRHPERFREVEDLLRQKNVPFILRSARTKATSGCWVMLLDTLGELTKFYGLATVAFVGKSLTRKGGHNLLEPASCGKPVVFGPHMDNFREVAEVITSEGGAAEVADFHDVVSAFDRLLADADSAREMGRCARNSVESRTGCVDRTVSKLQDILSTGRKTPR
jgi:3-deoxy-D-manno-octulosonic-acid transferase